MTFMGERRVVCSQQGLVLKALRVKRREALIREVTSNLHLSHWKCGNLKRLGRHRSTKDRTRKGRTEGEIGPWQCCPGKSDYLFSSNDKTLPCWFPSILDLDLSSTDVVRNKWQIKILLWGCLQFNSSIMQVQFACFLVYSVNLSWQCRLLNSLSKQKIFVSQNAGSNSLNRCIYFFLVWCESHWAMLGESRWVSEISASWSLNPWEKGPIPIVEFTDFWSSWG